MPETWMRLRLTAELHSDAHFGSGEGGGGVDALFARDRYQRPVIWASHIEGVLRDAARRLRGDESAAEFFGRAGGARQRAIFTSLYAEGCPESHIWRATARAAFDNRAPKDETLRAMECVPKGTRFVGEVELPATQLDTLKRLIQEVDALGAGRATHVGGVKLTLESAAGTPRRAGDTDAPTRRLRLLLKNRDPLCITATATPDNLIPSLAFVPGRTLLGALAAWLMDEGARDGARLLTSGKISVGDALPLPHMPSRLEDTEVLPAPLSLQSEKPKGTAGDVPWWAHPAVPPKRLNMWDTEEKLKRPEEDLFVFREVAESPWITYRPARRVRLRNGRPSPGQTAPSLVAIEQIAEETCFLADLHGSPDELKKLAGVLAPVLEGRRWLRVGRSGAPVEVMAFAWPGNPPPAKARGSALLILTSDLLMRDERLRWKTELDEHALRELTGCADLTVAKTERGSLRAVQEWVTIHGFNGTSRLWRVPAAAIRRGSVFEISGTAVSTLAERAARQEWLGERTHEGFGRFRIEVSLPGVTPAAAAPAVLDITPDVAEEAIARDTRDWLNKHEALAKSGRNGNPRPSLSQWMDLVADLERGDPNALKSRLLPATSGAKTWKHPDARAILEKLAMVAPSPQGQAPYARMFVRWLRAQLRAQPEEPQ
jgi:Uncharacterized protein predicted to be involved in DNA repair (RAMP superfamily)